MLESVQVWHFVGLMKCTWTFAMALDWCVLHCNVHCETLQHWLSQDDHLREHLHSTSVNHNNNNHASVHYGRVTHDPPPGQLVTMCQHQHSFLFSGHVHRKLLLMWILNTWCCNHHSHDSHDCDFCWLNVSMVCRLQLVTCVMIEWQGMVHPECSMITLYSCVRLFHYAAELEMSIIYCYCFITIHSN